MSYRAVNIVIYYFVIPFTYMCMLDAILGVHYFKVLFAITSAIIFSRVNSFESFSQWLFDRSVSFLKYFSKYGVDYVASSVVICVVLPLIVYAALFALL